MESASPLSSRGATYQPLLLVAMAVCVGIGADRWLGSALGGVGLFAWWTLAAMLTAGCFALRHSLPNLSAWVLLLAFAAISAAWHHDQWNYLEDNHLARFATYESEPICLRAIATGRTQWSPAPPANPLTVVPQSSRSVQELEVVAVRDGTRWRSVSGDCRLRVEGTLSGVERGDQLLAFAQFDRPRPALNPGQYHWAEAQRGQGRHVELFSRVPQCVTVEDATQPTEFGGLLDRASWWCEHQVNKYVGAGNRDLALALMLGQRERLQEDEFESFLRTGTVHLLVVSGLHVGFLAMFVWLLVRSGLLPQRWAPVATALVVILYALVVGARPPVLRAAILVLVGLSALTLGRQRSRANLLAAAALIVLLLNPSELFRGGTQLSFLCVAAIAGSANWIESLFRRDPLQLMVHFYRSQFSKTVIGARQWALRLVLVSCVIWTITAPLVAYHFNMAAPVSVLLTPLIWLFVAAALMAEFALCAFGWLLPPVGYLLGTIVSAALTTTKTVVSWADSSEWGHFYTAGPALWWLLGFYGLLALFALVIRERMNWKWQLAAMVLWVSVGLGSAAHRDHDRQLHCTFLAMGHGTCVVLELPGGQTLLYDAGNLGSPEGASRTIASYLWSRGISQIDAVVLSHADLDHYNAMPGLIERFPVGTVYISPLMFDPWATQGQLTAPNYLRETLAGADVPLREVWMNDRLQTSVAHLEIDFLHPPRTGVVGLDNANSLLMRIQYAGYTILLPGDLESPGIETVMAEPALDCDILLAPHHGSARSDPPGFAAWCTPEWVVVSGRDTGGRDDLTAASYQEVGARVLHTAQTGAVSFTISTEVTDSLQLSTFANKLTELH